MANTDWGSLIGSILGTGIGSFGGPGTARGAIGGGIGGMFGGGNEAGAQWLQNPQYSFTEPRMQLTSDYVSKGLQALQEGKPPTWFSNWEPIERKKRMGSLYQQYYGGQDAYGRDTFGPGLLATQVGQDVAAGRVGASGSSNYAKQLANYSGIAQAIDDYLSQLGSQAMETAEGRYLGTSLQIPEGPSGRWEGYEATPSAGQTIAGGIGSILPYMNWGTRGTGSIGMNQNELMNFFNKMRSGSNVNPGWRF
jgi:hypothetical protein